MNRPEAIALIGGAAAWPVAARAEQSENPVVGFLSGRSPAEAAASRDAHAAWCGASIIGYRAI
jgi:hypothetical protein